MKKTLIITLALMAFLANAQLPVSVIRIDIPANNWKFKQSTKAEWFPTDIPGTVHTALLKNGLIEDPFYRTNEAKLQWIEKEDWEYETNFDVNDELMSKKHIEMHWSGLDTYAKVFLNDSMILETNNMFRTWKIDIKPYLRSKGNHLHVYFESAVEKPKPEIAKMGYELPGGPRTMTRKAQFHYGWDWGPRFVGCGIYKTPKLVGWDEFIVDEIHTQLTNYDQNEAKLVAHFTYRSDVEKTITAETKIENTKDIQEKKLYKGEHSDSLILEIKNPKLWWCVGMGEQHLYQLVFDFKSAANESLDKTSLRAGLRTIELIQKPDEKGSSFYFQLNGVPVFAKGANYIPVDIFQDRVTPQRYQTLLNDAVDANMNMLRVWGGGIYEDDLFYELCDQKGILVWQDFMYACAMYPGNGAFFKNAAAEALDQIKRLRKHPCLALWCGNNENNEAWHNWGWQMNFNETQRAQLWKDYQLLFKDLLPTYVGNYGAKVPYWESSPSYGRANPKSLTQGDSHYWGVWHDEEPFSEYSRKVPRFMSEYGFQSFPDWKTIESFTLPEDRTLESEVMLAHQKHPKGNKLIDTYLRRDYQTPKSFEDLTYVSQLLQAEGMRSAIEAHRGAKPYCMGSLYWQLNDVWPVASWSGIDNFGRWKALHHYAKAAFAPIAALPSYADDMMKIALVSDLKQDTNVTLRIEVSQLNGKLLYSTEVPHLTISPDSAKFVWQQTTKNLIKNHKTADVFAKITVLDTLNNFLSERIFYFVPIKNLQLSQERPKINIAQVTEGYQISLTAASLLKNVYISAPDGGKLSDNYFDLLPGTTKVITFRTDRVLNDPSTEFRVRSLVETYAK